MYNVYCTVSLDLNYYYIYVHTVPYLSGEPVLVGGLPIGRYSGGGRPCPGPLQQRYLLWVLRLK